MQYLYNRIATGIPGTQGSNPPPDANLKEKNMNVTSSEWAHEDHMKFGASQGWWSRWDEVGPFKDLSVSLQEFGSFEEIAVHLGLFKSKTEARKNGWIGVATPGIRMMKKRRICVHILS
jgi:uncharacterized protein YukJ